MAVLVRGDGVAAYCAFHLLTRAGIPVVFERPSRPRLPVIMLSEAAIRLIADVFERQDLFRDLPRITSRAVLWGEAGEVVRVPHSAVVVSEEMLLDQLRPQDQSAALIDSPEWIIHATRPLPSEAVERNFGSRFGYALSVQLQDSKNPSCWVESTAHGWLFLIGNAQCEGWLLSVGCEPENGLAKSRLVAPQIDRIGVPSAPFPCFPRIVSPLGRSGGENWLACGTAAIGFDPICGDGTAHAVREAILAVAVIRAALAGAKAEDLVAHYESRLTAAFHRHLENCLSFYQRGGSGPWWLGELHGVEDGITWCRERLAQFPSFRYRLSGFELEKVS